MDGCEDEDEVELLESESESESSSDSDDDEDSIWRAHDQPRYSYPRGIDVPSDEEDSSLLVSEDEDEIDFGVNFFLRINSECPLCLRFLTAGGGRD